MDSGIAVKYFRPFLKNMLDLYYSEPPGVDEDEESSFFQHRNIYVPLRSSEFPGSNERIRHNCSAMSLDLSD